MKKYLICCGNSNDINTCSGIPFHFLNSAKELSLDLEGIKLDPVKLSKYKLVWNLKQLLCTGGFSGFQYSDFFLRNLIKQAQIKKEENALIISHYPFLPDVPNSKNLKVVFYLDATTKQIIEEYKLNKFISKKYKEKILRKEKLNYKYSNFIFTMSCWAKESLIRDYAIKPEKIKVLPCGANIQNKYLKDKDKIILPKPPTFLEPLKIGFNGKDWNRKGGPISLKIVEHLNKNDIPAVLRVMGVSNNTLPDSKYIQNLGLIDKSKNMDKFISEIQSWHFGTLFSKSEAFGISNRECFLLGVPVICFDVGGIRSTFPDDDENYGRIFKPKEKIEVISNWISETLKDYSSYIQLRKNIYKNNEEFKWDTTVKRLFNSLSLI